MDRESRLGKPGRRIAVVGSGVAGLSCAWALAQDNDVALYEAESRLGGHADTHELAGRDGPIAVDTGFIVYNEPTYPNLKALFGHLGVETAATEMSFAVSLDGGAYEYSGKGLRGLFAQPANALRPRFWSMLRDLVRFYAAAPRDAGSLGETSLDEYLARGGYGEAFVRDHLLPMAAAIWSTPAAEVGAFPAAAFIRFCDNHGLLKLAGRPVWRTVRGGSRGYVQLLAQAVPDIRVGAPVTRVSRLAGAVEVCDAGGGVDRFDEVVIAAHADAALAMLDQPSAAERRLLGAFRYAPNVAHLHSDASLMPRRRAAWAAWNYLAQTGGDRWLGVSYWMNALQPLGDAPDLFVTLNPPRPPRDDLTHACKTYRHPQFDLAAMAAQKALWSLQGVDRVWFCGAYFGSGFHEDGLQAGLAVAEQMTGRKRPWRVAGENGRIFVSEPPPPELARV